jgi:hypothetical protein
MKAASILVALALVFWALPAVAQEKPWFDMQNCDFCKFLVKDSNLLKNMLWEHHDLSNGLLVVTAVKPESKAAYEEAMAGMAKMGEEMAKGKTDVKMCGHCEYFGKLMMSGVKIENIATSVGDITLMTTDNPETLKMICEYGRRNKEELAKLGAPE